MKKVFQIFVISSNAVCVPLEDYDSQRKWYADIIPTIHLFSWQEFDTEDEALKFLEDHKNLNTDVDYTILPVFKFKLAE